MIDADKLAALAADMAALPQTELRPVLESTELHVDGDYLAYYFSGNDDTAFGSARRNTLDCIENVARIVGAGGRKVLHLTSGCSSKGDRFIVATEKPYQGQRDSGRKPKNWEAMRNWLESGDIGRGWKVKIWTDREADDGVACAARYALQCGRTPGIFTRDKDFRMIPGLHVEWDTLGMVEVKADTFCVYGTDPDNVYGSKWFWLQMLQGDTADNIPGCPKVYNDKGDKLVNCGPKTAEKILLPCKTNEECFAAVRASYLDCYGPIKWADALVEQAVLLWMRNDNEASVDNFLKAIPYISAEILQAVRKLEKRIASIKGK